LPAIRRSVLILSGTREASALAARLAARPDLRVITSLAGRTRRPEPVRGETRIGGFGGTDGLAAFLRDEGIDVLIDATHPFATTISSHAVDAARRTGIERLLLVRPPWRPADGDLWQEVRTLEDGCAAIPPASRVLLALGRQHIDAFAGRDDVFFLLRMVDPPAEALPFKAMELVLGKPGPEHEEATLLRAHAIDRIVCRNAGGTASFGKIAAARQLAIPVIMLERPPQPAGRAFETVEGVAAAIA